MDSQTDPESHGHIVEVHNLKTTSDGGILDQDDTLKDVVDDREQLIAEFEEHGRGLLPHNGGDGASASSTGTASPEMFHSDTSTSASLPPHAPSTPPHLNGMGKTDVVVTTLDLPVASSLRVRRGSEPALNLINGSLPNGQPPNGEPPPPARRRESVEESDEPRSESDSEVELSRHGDKTKPLLNWFQRSSLRQSLTSSNTYRWLEAQNQQEAHSSLVGGEERKGPIGGDGKDNLESHYRDESELICLHNDGGPLGIHVIPDYDENGRDLGLIVQGVEEGGRIHRDGRLQQEDRIVEINGDSLVDVSFSRAQEIFRGAMKTQEICLRVVHTSPSPHPHSLHSPKVLPKPRRSLPLKPSPLTLPAGHPGRMEENSQDQQTNSPPSPASSSPTQPPSPSKKTPPAVPARHPSTALSSFGKGKDVAPINTLTNTRKIGKKIDIQLKKGPTGLGFSVTSRDNPTTGKSPIYIKNILPKGAAIDDGLLKPGDRLLEVNGEEMTGRPQRDVVDMLRNIPEGTLVTLVVSRQEAVDERFQVPRKLDTVADVGAALPSRVSQQPEQAGDDGTLTLPRSKDVHMLDIPLNDTGSAGLGVSVKGKTIASEQGARDLGIFVKSIMHGGAASKDGRLLVNDQLLEVNGIPLVGAPNVEAMERLRQAMQYAGPKPGYIQLTVARRLGAPSPFPSNESSSDNSTLELTGGSFGVPILPSPREEDEDTVGTGKQGFGPGARGPEMFRPGQPGRSLAAGTKFDLKDQTGTKGMDRPDGPAWNNDKAEGPTPAAGKVGALTAKFNGLSEGPSIWDRRRGSAPNEQGLPPGVPPGGQRSATVVPPASSGEVIIEDDTYAFPRKQHQQFPDRPRPHSTIGFAHGQYLDCSSSSEELQPGSQRQPQGSTTTDGQESDLSPTGDPMMLFQREGFGRQSMSEKRKGHLDPKGSEFYQKAKTQKENRGQSGFQRDFGDVPLTNLKRASSLEDLSQVEGGMDGPDGGMGVEDISGEGGWRPRTQIGRPRACNDSFRAAVDRSYDPPASGPEHALLMDTLEEESTDSVSFGAQTNSARSSFSSETAEEGQGQRTGKKKNKDRRSAGLFKGFLRLGRGRKSAEDARARSRSEERPNRLVEETIREAPVPSQPLPSSQENFHRKEEISHQRQSSLPEHTGGLTGIPERSSGITEWGGQERGVGVGGWPPGLQTNLQPVPQSRAERIQQLRAEHQRRHRERNGRYPLEEEEERQIQLTDRRVSGSHQLKEKNSKLTQAYMQGQSDFHDQYFPVPSEPVPDRPGSRPAYESEPINYNYFPSDPSSDREPGPPPSHLRPGPQPSFMPHRPADMGYSRPHPAQPTSRYVATGIPTHPAHPPGSQPTQDFGPRPSGAQPHPYPPSRQPQQLPPWSQGGGQAYGAQGGWGKREGDRDYGSLDRRVMRDPQGGPHSRGLGVEADMRSRVYSHNDALTDPQPAYRHPVQAPVAGRRSVQTILSESSAKV